MEKIFYFAQVVNGVTVVARVALGVFLVAALVMTISYFNDYMDGNEAFTKALKGVWIGLVITVLAVIFVPTKQTFLFMVGGRVIDQTVAANPQVKEIPGNTLDLLNEYIKTTTEELRQKQAAKP